MKTRTSKPKTTNPHNNNIFKAKEKNTQKEESRSTTTKEIYAQKDIAETRGI
jgi:hypothetical protein